MAVHEAAKRGASEELRGPVMRDGDLKRFCFYEDDKRVGRPPKVVRQIRDARELIVDVANHLNDVFDHKPEGEQEARVFATAKTQLEQALLWVQHAIDVRYFSRNPVLNEEDENESVDVIPDDDSSLASSEHHAQPEVEAYIDSVVLKSGEKPNLEIEVQPRSKKEARFVSAGHEPDVNLSAAIAKTQEETEASYREMVKQREEELKKNDWHLYSA